jgi:hypothetical protein
MDKNADEKLAGAIDKFNRVKAAASARQPTAMVKQVTKRDELGRITEVTETPVTDPQVPNADDVLKVATEVTEAAVEAIQEAKRQGTVTAGQLSAQMADQVVEAAKAVAEETAARHVEEVIEDFRRAEDEFEDDEEDDDLEGEEDIEDLDAQDPDDPGLFRTPAKVEADFERDLTAIVEEKIEPLVAEVARQQAQIREVGKAIIRRRAEVDGLTYLLQELGSWSEVRRFFKIARSQPLTGDHPFLTDRRLRVFAFPGAEGLRHSNETSAEYQEEEYEAQSDNMQDKPHKTPGRSRSIYDGDPTTNVFMARGRRQSLHDERPADLDREGNEVQDLRGPGGSGGQDFRAHRAPQADNVLLSEYRPRTVKRAVRRRGLWSGN